LSWSGGITVYPAQEKGDRWRAVWQENGQRRQCEGSSEARLAQKLEKVTERLAADAPGMERPGARPGAGSDRHGTSGGLSYADQSPELAGIVGNVGG
jgi:hypothetical protein